MIRPGVAPGGETVLLLLLLLPSFRGANVRERPSAAMYGHVADAATLDSRTLASETSSTSTNALTRPKVEPPRPGR